MAENNIDSREPDIFKLTLEAPSKPRPIDISKLPIAYVPKQIAHDPAFRTKKPMTRLTKKQFPGTSSQPTDQFGCLAHAATVRDSESALDRTRRSALHLTCHPLTHYDGRTRAEKCGACLLHDVEVLVAQLVDKTARVENDAAVHDAQLQKLGDMLLARVTARGGERDTLG
ncbi:DNA mismatch repair protein MutS domain protein [Marssonina coronariae]|uniref:DNA mismatch repair protein MutS domain protein n=1 Tax=Diplocarpon coronariae TaxID=2795749 RepID=A0A218YXY9_9HELO|nr:DNA mismatch repair protein MutS domain protein [Marssonina coronariae]